MSANNDEQQLKQKDVEINNNRICDINKSRKDCVCCLRTDAKQTRDTNTKCCFKYVCWCC